MLGVVEATGLALAILPIMMAAAGYQPDAPVTIMRQKKMETKVLACFKMLHDELALLSANLRHLISRLPQISDERKQQLLKLDRTAWRDQTLGDALRLRLADSYEAVLNNMKEILSMLDDIVSCHAINVEHGDMLIGADGSLLYAKLQQLREETGSHGKGFKTRLRFTSKEAKLRRSLQTLTKSNKVLERLLTRTLSLDLPSTTESIISTRSPPPIKINELTRAVHASFIRHWTCSCGAQHEARLCVNIPFASGTSGLPTMLEMFISARAEKQERWQQSSVHLDTDIQPDLELTESPVGVRFELPDVDAPTVPRSRRSSLTESSKKQIIKMCDIIEQAHRDGATLDLLLDRQTLWHIKSSQRRAKVQEPQPRSTLLDLLGDARSPCLRDRKRLAVILANALLHLKGSDWLEDGLSNKDIRFMYGPNGSLNMMRPYVSVAMLEADRSESLGSDTASQLHECPPLLNLGIVLLELGLSRPLEPMRTEEDLTDGMPNANTDLTTALRVLGESVGDLSLDYHAAIEACLNCRFILTGAFDFSDEGFREAVYRRVVEPLERDLFSGWKEKPEHLWKAAVS